MKQLLFFLLILGLVFMFAACGKTESANVKWTAFSDPYFRVKLNYPDGWVSVMDGDKLSIYSSQEVIQHFSFPGDKGPDGVQFQVNYSKTANLDLKKSVDEIRAGLDSAGYTLKDLKDFAFDSTKALQFEYSGKFENATIYGIRTFAVKDSMLYEVSYSAFNKFYDSYRSVCDTLFASIRLPDPRAPKVVKDLEAPSTELTNYDTEFLSMMVPDNFNPSPTDKKGEIMFGVRFSGVRLDCTVSLDVRPAKKLSTDKAFEQLIKPLPSQGSKGEAAIDGEKALYVNYAPMKEISSRMYIAVKNDKIYRVVFNYKSSLKDKFLPTFEKMVSTIKVK